VREEKRHGKEEKEDKGGKELGSRGETEEPGRLQSMGSQRVGHD